MTEWDWNYLSMSDEEFAYVTGLTRGKIEQVKTERKRGGK